MFINVEWRREKMANRPDKYKIITRIIAGTMAALMVLGTVAGVLYTLLAK